MSELNIEHKTCEDEKNEKNEKSVKRKQMLDKGTTLSNYHELRNFFYDIKDLTKQEYLYVINNNKRIKKERFLYSYVNMELSCKWEVEDMVERWISSHNNFNLIDFDRDKCRDKLKSDIDIEFYVNYELDKLCGIGNYKAYLVYKEFCENYGFTMVFDGRMLGMCLDREGNLDIAKDIVKYCEENDLDIKTKVDLFSYAANSGDVEKIKYSVYLCDKYNIKIDIHRMHNAPIRWCVSHMGPSNYKLSSENELNYNKTTESLKYILELAETKDEDGNYKYGKFNFTYDDFVNKYKSYKGRSRGIDKYERAINELVGYNGESHEDSEEDDINE